MKRIFSLLAVIVAIGVLAPAGIFAAQEPSSLCPEHPGQTCFLKDGAFHCNWTEDAVKTKVTREGRAGQLENRVVHDTEVKTHQCAAWEHPAGE